MKGLLIKDIKLLTGQINSFLIIFVIGLFFMFSNEDPSFAVGYISILFSIFTLSTLSYDEYDHGMSFLLTLPISRKLYVREKYLFGAVSVVISCVISNLLMLVIAVGIRQMPYSIEMVYMSLGCVWAAALILAISLPLKIKFGVERERVVMLVFAGVAFLAAFLIVKAASYLKIDAAAILGDVLEKCENAVAPVLILLCLAMMGISYVISVRIMEKKEF